MTKKPVLVFACGNPSRGDDAIGPEFLRMIEGERKQGSMPGNFDTLTDFQLQVEHVLDMENRELVLFVDASVSAGSPFEFDQVTPLKDNSFTTHAMSPSALLAVYGDVCLGPAPATFLLAIQGFEFDLGKPISNKARDNLMKALGFAGQLFDRSTPEYWQQMATQVESLSAAI